jgi:hypothetical protein
MWLSDSGRLGAMTLSLVLLGVAWLTPSPRGFGQEPAPARKEAKGKWLPLFQTHANEYTVRVGSRDGEARMLPDPVLRWWQPVRGGDDGALYLWVREGQPVAAVTFFTYKLPNGVRWINHERHSFVSEPVEATWRDRVVWTTSQPGLSFQPVPGAPAPADTAPVRLRQMQAIAREFAANTVDDKGSTWPLRPLARPVYRYESKTDGAVFVMVQGTDPEAFLLLRVRGEGSDTRWEYAVTRFTDLEIHIRLEGREVYSGPHTIGAANEIYQTVGEISKTSDSPEDFR